MEEAEEEDESSSHGSASPQLQARASADVLMPPTHPRGYVEHWLAFSMGDQQQNQTSDTEAAAAAGSSAGLSVASLVQHFEALPTGQPAAAQPPLTEPPSAEEPVCLTQPARPLANRLRLAPLQVDRDVVLPEEADSEAAAAVPDSGPETAEVGLQPSLRGTAVATPKACRQSALQGAAARNQAAIATHRARQEQHSAAGGPQHGWTTPITKTLLPASPRSPATQPSSLTIRRGGSAAFPSALNLKHRLLPSPRAMSSSPTLQRGGSVTVAQIMKQNSRLPPLDLVPSAPSSPHSALRPLPPLRRGSLVAGSSGLPLALQRGASLGTRPRRGNSVVRSGAASAAHHDGSSATQAPGSFQQSEPPAGIAKSSPRHTSVTFSEESRRRIRLSPISPRVTGSAAPLMRVVSGNQGSPNRSAKQGFNVSLLQSFSFS